MTMTSRVRELYDQFGDDGKLPYYAWAGRYSIYYMTQRGVIVCGNCASHQDASDPVVTGNVNWQNLGFYCGNCGDRIERKTDMTAIEREAKREAGICTINDCTNPHQGLSLSRCWAHGGRWMPPVTGRAHHSREMHNGPHRG